MRQRRDQPMFETPLTVVGHIVNDPVRRKVGDQELIKFRVASNSRRRTGDGSWEPGNSLFITVNCWGRLVSGVGAALGKGAPVIVAGHVYTSEYEDRDGNRRSSLEMRATAVGPDLSRVVRAHREARLHRPRRRIRRRRRPRSPKPVRRSPRPTTRPSPATPPPTGARYRCRLSWGPRASGRCLGWSARSFCKTRKAKPRHG